MANRRAGLQHDVEDLGGSRRTHAQRHQALHPVGGRFQRGHVGVEEVEEQGRSQPTERAAPHHEHAAAGAGVGLLASLVVARWLARVTPAATSPALWVWLLAPLVLIAAVVIASVLPARRAGSVSPLAIMRDT